MSFLDPANVFGGGGSRVGDPLGLFNRGGGPMSQQQRSMRQTMGPQRFDTEGQQFGGAAGAGRMGGEFERQEMAQAPQGGGMRGGFSANPADIDIASMAAMQRANQAGGQPAWGGGAGLQQWGQMSGQLAGAGPSFGGFNGGKPAPIQQGPNPAAMAQSQGGGFNRGPVDVSGRGVPGSRQLGGQDLANAMSMQRRLRGGRGP